MQQVIEIPAPHFDLYQLVILHWEGQQHVTEVLKRVYDLDECTWSYGVRGLDGLYSPDYIDFKTEKK